MASLSSLFGYILNFIYSLVHNYGVAIIIFSFLLKLLLLPISIKQQKTMKKTAKIQGKAKELQEKYKNDPNKMNQEIMALYKQENVSPLGGCLPAILQLVFLLAMFGLVRNPITYMLKQNPEVINKVANYIQLENNNINRGYPQISILKYVSNNRGKTIDLGVIDYIEENKEEKTDNEELIKKYNEQKNTAESEENKNEENLVDLDSLYINMNFLGLDLSNIPQENWNDWTVFVIPVLYVITSMISMKVATKLTSPKDKKEIIEVEKEEQEANEEEKQEKKEDLSPEDMSAQMSKSMTWFMPIMSVSISLVAPLGLALYWLVNNMLMIVERVVLNKVLKTEGEE